ncbi:reverse transcriptase (RNA-dependent DNA polymerase) domain-containing protein [Phthorimaea operculella]|nr:reverse transcriptase (RNA-dependent DNA polymerase) domain-containing protein [Phthorimaea operculella]
MSRQLQAEPPGQHMEPFVAGANSEVNKRNLFELLKSKFSCKSLGTLKNCLGVRIHRDRAKGILMLEQSDYIKKLLSRFGMTNCKSVSTPMIVNSKFEKAKSDNALPDDTYPYRELIGCLMYLSVCSRPDITFALSHLRAGAHRPDAGDTFRATPLGRGAHQAAFFRAASPRAACVRRFARQCGPQILLKINWVVQMNPTY